jgi:hypothetical protein
MTEIQGARQVWREAAESRSLARKKVLRTVTVARTQVKPMDAFSSPRSASGMLVTLVTMMMYIMW